MIILAWMCTLVAVGLSISNLLAARRYLQQARQHQPRTTTGLILVGATNEITQALENEADQLIAWAIVQAVLAVLATGTAFLLRHAGYALGIP